MAYTVIEGVIGVGKTALTRILGNRLLIPTVFEQFEENPFLSKFYGDRARYAFQTEVFFLLNRYRQQQAIVKPLVEAGNLASDYLFGKTRLFAGMNLHGDEMALFEQIFEELDKQVPVPGLVVYLRASVETLMARIYQRDRSFERSMEWAYIEELSHVYEGYFSNYDRSPLLTLDTDDIDIVRDAVAQEEVTRRILAAQPAPD